MKDISSVTILGTRGSVAVSGDAFRRYGHGTTCVLVRMAGQTVILDAGTGIMGLDRYLRPEETQLSLVLTHTHADHVMGFVLCPFTFRPDCRLDVYGKTRDGLTIRQQLERLMSPPLWPIGPEILPADIRFHALKDDWSLGALRIQAVEGVHPDGVSLLRLTGGDRSVVMMTDCIVESYRRSAFLDFARDCDLLLCDGQYSPEEWTARSDFGHSTWEQAARFGRDCGAKMVRIIHHDPFHDDQTLDGASGQLREIHPRCSFAREGEELVL